VWASPSSAIGRIATIVCEKCDILLVRTGWYTVFQNDRELWDQRQPGPDPSSTGWLKSKDAFALGVGASLVTIEHKACCQATSPWQPIITCRTALPRRGARPGIDSSC